MSHRAPFSLVLIGLMLCVLLASPPAPAVAGDKLQIVTLSTQADKVSGGDVHMKYYHFSTRERLLKANGHANNMVMWAGVFGPRAGILTQAFLQMAAWLDNLTADTSETPLDVKVVQTKPAGLTDGCWSDTTAPFTFVAEHQFLGGPGTSACNTLTRAICSRAMWPARH